MTDLHERIIRALDASETPLDMVDLAILLKEDVSGALLELKDACRVHENYKHRFRLTNEERMRLREQTPAGAPVPYSSPGVRAGTKEAHSESSPGGSGSRPEAMATAATEADPPRTPIALPAGEPAPRRQNGGRVVDLFAGETCSDCRYIDECAEPDCAPGNPVYHPDGSIRCGWFAAKTPASTEQPGQQEPGGTVDLSQAVPLLDADGHMTPEAQRSLFAMMIEHVDRDPVGRRSLPVVEEEVEIEPVQTTIRLPESLHSRVRIECRKRRTSLSELVSELLLREFGGTE